MNTAFDAIVLIMLTYLPAYLCGETGASGDSTEKEVYTHYYYTDVVVPYSLMI